MNTPMDVVKNYPVRKSKKQKQAFRADVTQWLQNLGYPVFEEEGSFHSCNLVIGDPQRARYLVTAHDDTCARLPFPRLLTPCNFWTVLLYQIFICVMLMLPALAVGGLVGYLLHSFNIGYFLFVVLLWAAIVLMLIGPANSSNVNDNTSGVVTLLEIARSIPELHRKNVCFVLFDLKIGELKHQDIGQMQMYVHYYDRKMKLPEENPTIGIILCKDKNNAVVEMTLPEDNSQIFASKYETVLPSKEDLQKLLEEQQN